MICGLNIYERTFRNICVTNNQIITADLIVSSCSYLKLDVVHITVQNKFQWICGSKSDMNAVHREILTISVRSLCLSLFVKFFMEMLVANNTIFLD